MDMGGSSSECRSAGPWGDTLHALCWHKPGPPDPSGTKGEVGTQQQPGCLPWSCLCISKRGQRTTTFWLYWALSVWCPRNKLNQHFNPQGV